MYVPALLPLAKVLGRISLDFSVCACWAQTQLGLMKFVPVAPRQKAWRVQLSILAGVRHVLWWTAGD